MKKFFLISSILLFLSCSSDLEELNVDQKNATFAPPEAFFNLAVKNLSDLLSGIEYGATVNPWSNSRLLVQQISSVTYNEGTTYYLSFNWSSVYQDVLINLQQSKKVIETSEASSSPESKNKLAILEIMQVYTYGRLVETFGNIPYSEALDINIIIPKYDDAEIIYIDLLNRLSTAINNLDESQASWNQDILYAGDVGSWKKFGKSLQLQMGMRIVDSNLQLATETIVEAIPGVFTTNEDNAKLVHLSAPPNTAELWTDLAVGNRKDYVGAEPFVNLLNELEDPRRSVYFKPENGEYIGSPSGLVVSYDDFSKYGEIFYQPTTPTIFMDYASVEFFLAEAAERNIGSVTDSEAHYNAAITASFEYYGLGDSIEAYLAQIEVAYTTAEGTWQQKIATQKWLALFNQSPEGYTEWRRMDYPTLIAPPDSFIDTVPVRFRYPISEQTLNSANYESAASAIGGDVMTTKLFWDVN
ncbi:SusD/RagB family nutrient-binding outer membrane lipoprotein [Maribacter sp. ACAM166]|uniref:SusD/RagB family nutrient-binding outer membrane lipoprotein n=1 Tax=Maribacter sp. ACAM166 TaxID=2508996 RepID=UPI0010FED625|nr:SusD/RagB family nutrient-binding outer membrane lipoprotein [Maribacter sp. ACAM166]TLP82834.1 SusD/RagB family nutrient-binding outer membrane lipoprotein [Maribacter sp. ACAM166]